MRIHIEGHAYVYIFLLPFFSCSKICSLTFLRWLKYTWPVSIRNPRGQELLLFRNQVIFSSVLGFRPPFIGRVRGRVVLPQTGRREVADSFLDRACRSSFSEFTIRTRTPYTDLHKGHSTTRLGPTCEKLALILQPATLLNIYGFVDSIWNRSLSLVLTKFPKFLAFLDKNVRIALNLYYLD